MCMKTKGRMTQCPIIHRPFWPKNAKIRDNRGENRTFLKGKQKTSVARLFLPVHGELRGRDAAGVLLPLPARNIRKIIDIEIAVA
jgi:hypothetical protein